MEWVLSYALYWWVVVATIFVTAIVRTSSKEPETRSVVVKSSSGNERMRVKKF